MKLGNPPIHGCGCLPAGGRHILGSGTKGGKLLNGDGKFPGKSVNSGGNILGPPGSMATGGRGEGRRFSLRVVGMRGACRSSSSSMG